MVTGYRLYDLLFRTLLWERQAVSLMQKIPFVWCFTTSAILQIIFHNHVLYAPVWVHVLTNNFNFHQICYSWENVLVSHLPKTFVDVYFYLQSAVALYKQYYSENIFDIRMYKSYAEQRKAVVCINYKTTDMFFCSLFMLFCEIIIFKIILCEMSFLYCKYILIKSALSLWFNL